jgi:hypothetical protein
VTSCAVIRKLEPPAASPEGAQSPAASTSAKGSPSTTSSGRPLAMPLSPWAPPWSTVPLRPEVHSRRPPVRAITGLPFSLELTAVDHPLWWVSRCQTPPNWIPMALARSPTRPPPAGRIWSVKCQQCHGGEIALFWPWAKMSWRLSLVVVPD